MQQLIKYSKKFSRVVDIMQGTPTLLEEEKLSGCSVNDFEPIIDDFHPGDQEKRDILDNTSTSTSTSKSLDLDLEREKNIILTNAFGPDYKLWHHIEKEWL